MYWISKCHCGTTCANLMNVIRIGIWRIIVCRLHNMGPQFTGGTRICRVTWGSRACRVGYWALIWLRESGWLHGALQLCSHPDSVDGECLVPLALQGWDPVGSCEGIMLLGLVNWGPVTLCLVISVIMFSCLSVISLYCVYLVFIV